jgi:hypothetical protein
MDHLLGLILVGLRIPEIGQHAVPHVPGNKPPLRSNGASKDHGS